MKKQPMNELELTRNILAFYMAEESLAHKPHPIEKEYMNLAGITPNKRTSKQNKRLVKLSGILNQAIEESEKLFVSILDVANNEKQK